jgi:hypothetical protein
MESLFRSVRFFVPFLGGILISLGHWKQVTYDLRTGDGTARAKGDWQPPKQPKA